MTTIVQRGPEDSADLLEDVVLRCTYKPGWTLGLEVDRERGGEHLAGSKGTTLTICADLPDSTKAEGLVGVGHFFAVPPAAYNRETWERWVYDCCVLVEIHEAMEWFKVDGQAPFFPAHGDGNGNNPYTIERRRPGDNRPGAPEFNG